MASKVMRNLMPSVMRLFTAVLVMVCLSQNPALAAKRESIQVEWNELEQLISGRTVALHLPDGTDVAGKVRSVRADGLEMEIKKTSNAQAHAKGRGFIPRSGVSILELKKTQGPWRVIGTAIGAGGGFLLGGLASVAVAPERNSLQADTKAVLAVVIGVITAVGYLLGRRVDRKVTRITIVSGSTEPKRSGGNQ